MVPRQTPASFDHLSTLTDSFHAVEIFHFLFAGLWSWRQEVSHSQKNKHSFRPYYYKLEVLRLFQSLLKANDLMDTQDMLWFSRSQAPVDPLPCLRALMFQCFSSCIVFTVSTAGVYYWSLNHNMGNRRAFLHKTSECSCHRSASLYCEITLRWKV